MIDKMETYYLLPGDRLSFLLNDETIIYVEAPTKGVLKWLVTRRIREMLWRGKRGLERFCSRESVLRSKGTTPRYISGRFRRTLLSKRQLRAAKRS